MSIVSMRDFRRDAARFLRRCSQRPILTHRGKPVARLEPFGDEALKRDDPFYSLCELAESAGPLTTRHIDRIVYGQ